MWRCTIKDEVKFEKSRKDVKSLLFWRDVSCEFVVTSFLISTIIIISTTNDENIYKPNTTHFGLYAALFVYTLLETYGPVSCLAHPPATFCLFLAGRISLARALIYTVVQIAGCAAGAGVGYALTPMDKRDTFVPFNPMENGLTNLQAMFVEALFTFNLIIVILSTLADEFTRKYPILPNLAIACALGTATMAAGTFTGGFTNPLISMGVAILTQDFTNHWIYWAGPYLGGMPGVCLYKLYVWVKKRDDRISREVMTSAAEEELFPSKN